MVRLNLTKPFFIKITMLAALFSFSSPSLAFQLGDHDQITIQALNEYKNCVPAYRNINQEWLAEAVRSEDTDLVTKELRFSHFYNPKKKLNLWWRLDSMGRIDDLEPSLMQCHQKQLQVGYDEISELGHMIHHFQDMAVPAHVVPVNHSAWDGFESYPVSGDISSGFTCAQIIAFAESAPEDILRETATETLGALATMQFQGLVASNNSAITMTGSDFWVESNDSSFGQYGPVGNGFGQGQLQKDGLTIFVAPAWYDDFKRNQMRLAVRASLRGLAWTLR